MKRIFLIVLMFVTAAGFAAAQIQAPTSDVLGAHLNYGRGCAGCHAPHSGVYGNGNAKTADAGAGGLALWGEDVGSLYGKPLTFAGNTIETLPASLQAGTPDVTGVLMCLSCHDGNYAKGAMMKGTIYETLPGTYGAYNAVPTLLGNDPTGPNNYLNDHPVGLNATVSCGGAHNWDCTETAGVIIMNGANSSQFVQNYGFFVSLSAYNNTAVVTCTSCHNQHLMNVVSVGPVATNAKTGAISGSGLPAGNYATMFFIRAPYNPASGTAGSNQTAQFCRQCHGGEANESNGSYSIPTTF
jgi:nitrate/TMAO reductase-like tetraheme cytochrome c subunit